MKINFEKFPCFTNVSKTNTMETNVKELLANIMYLNGGGIAMGALALKIYNSHGEEEYSKQECLLMLNFIKSDNFAPVFILSFEQYIKEHESNNE